MVVSKDLSTTGLDGHRPGQIAWHKPRIRLTAAQIRTIPQQLPITEGRVHFLRPAEADGTITLLNECWLVGRAYADQYVWAVIWTHRECLEVYYRRSAHHRLQVFPFSGYDMG